MTSREFQMIEEISGDFKGKGGSIAYFESLELFFLVMRKIDFWKSFGPASKSLSQLKDHSLEISLFP